jgi:hypothetical protein
VGDELTPPLRHARPVPLPRLYRRVPRATRTLRCCGRCPSFKVAFSVAPKCIASLCVVWQGLPASLFTTDKKAALIHATPRYLVKSKYLEDQNAHRPILAIVPTGWSTAPAPSSTSKGEDWTPTTKTPSVVVSAVPQVRGSNRRRPSRNPALHGSRVPTAPHRL